ncbi:hypothetical protein HYH03_003724 [Edaphochlamys debaryana]|uniref:Protein kinase domain-containing protein n=1 Tax=Edaphochlamys debaryana TaxID=47281 RepID=A0A835YCT8_9CHLO|nr:hypothetical protein HYH03_003724 [Edaphochlamys debaryana]|eukprot:KAG2498471.1 hypothetical protein HYH03_003724 [Edaphochlamys debaryana]
MAGAFAAAAAITPGRGSITTAVLRSDVWMTEPDWSGLLLSNGTEPVLLSRDFLIVGDPSLPSWPLLNLGLVHAKVRIASGVTLTVRHVIIGDFRSGLITQAPGFDLAAPTQLPTPTSRWGSLVHNETAVLYSICFPKAAWQPGLDTAPRPAWLPGTQQALLGEPQDGCVNASSSALLGSPVLQPALQSRCWSDRGRFTDMAFYGADPDSFGKVVPNNYTVTLINVTYLCAYTMPMDCVRRLEPLGCALWIMSGNATGQDANAGTGLVALPWQLPTGDSAVMEVRTGRDLAVAFASNPWITTAKVMSDIWMTEADWTGLLGNPNGTEPVLLSRDFLIIGDPSLPSWPLLNMGYVHLKVRIASGVTLTVRHVIIGDFRSGLLTQAPGFDLAAPTQLPTPTSLWGSLLHNETAVLYSVCLPKTIWASGITGAPRPAWLPGEQIASLGDSQEGCVNTSAWSPQTANSSAGGGSAQSSLLQPPLQSRCWADRGRFIDMSVYAMDPNAVGRLVPSNYTVNLRGVQYLCAYTAPEDCIARLQPLGCALSLMRLNDSGASAVLPWDKSAPSTPAPLVSNGTVADTTGSSGGGGDESFTNVALAAGLAAGLGGAALIGVVVFLWVWARRRKAAAAAAACKTAEAAPASDPEQSSRRCAEGKGIDSAERGGAPCSYDGAYARPSEQRSHKPLLQILHFTKGSQFSKLSTRFSALMSSGTPTATATLTSEHLEGVAVAASRSDGLADSGPGSGPALVSPEGGYEGGLHDASSHKAGAPAVVVTTDDAGGNGLPPAPNSQNSASLTATGTTARSGRSGRSGRSDPSTVPSKVDVERLLEEEHVVVTSLTPPRADLALGEAAANEVQLLPTVLGRGAFGRVYEGLWTSTGERVAVKVMRDVFEDGAPVDHLRASFAQEVEVLGRCCHPNVVRLLAACVQPPRMLLVMELMETSLERVVYCTPPVLIPLPKVLMIFLDIARGLEYLHPTILHRDLKPANVLINNPTGERPVAKLTDFGVSRLRSTVLVTKHPEAGTPAYMAPETFDVKNYTLSHHVDVYSFGVCLWVCLTGEHPWQGLTMVEVAYKVTIGRERLPLAGLPQERCPPRVRALLEQCFEHEPRRRPAAAEVAKELKSILESL